MQGFLKPYQVEQIKKKYPVGTKIQLDHMDGERDMPDGLLGEVKYVDDQGQLHMKWQNGRNLALVPNLDSFHILREAENENSENDECPDGCIRVLVVEPHKNPYVSTVKNDYRAMQELVGGCIEFVPLSELNCHLYCNDEGKLNGLTGNRRMDNGDIICGTFFICTDDGEGNDASLSNEQITYFSNRFHEPEFYSNTEAHSFAMEVGYADSKEEFLRMLGIVPEADENDFER
ncbi:hypothetical protein CLNEO_10870 [Anaerotignum neopropionicum]|uniref:Uncharacterized protein n=1 Tax=Anaerotignum neopropionicum TaxID=36847 RepID=A0A136WH55_9FIRM|nr:DUF3846 domain-containing protein [Anaerotignum neopropionicum]KXL53861.1 hypothetical protein CLNEO_10870 [Anaerotignum neopropionicum]